MRMWHIYNTCKTLYIGVELLLQLEIVVYSCEIGNNKSCKIMRLNTSTHIRYTVQEYW